MKRVNATDRQYLRTIIFGIEDSLVSTTGLIAGIGVGSDNKKFVLLAGFVAIFIEAISMGAGEYVSDDAVNNGPKQKNLPIINGFLMFFSYILAGLLPLAPVLLASYPESLAYGILLAFAGLFLLGWAKGKILGTSPLRSGLKILIVGGLATIAGIVIGSFFEID